MTARGHDVMITSCDKDVTVNLLSQYGLEHEVLSTQGTGRVGLAKETGDESALAQLHRARSTT